MKGLATIRCKPLLACYQEAELHNKPPHGAEVAWRFESLDAILTFQLSYRISRDVWLRCTVSKEVQSRQDGRQAAVPMNVMKPTTVIRMDCECGNYRKCSLHLSGFIKNTSSCV